MMIKAEHRELSLGISMVRYLGAETREGADVKKRAVYHDLMHMQLLTQS